MQQFEIDDDLAALVERLAKKRPFENLSFNVALRRILEPHLPSPASEVKPNDLEKLPGVSVADLRKEPKKAPSPSAEQWVNSVSDLSTRRGLNNWKAICNFLKIETAGDSARRKLKNWVKVSHPEWPPVPEID
jgi:hypothetical protein